MPVPPPDAKRGPFATGDGLADEEDTTTVGLRAVTPVNPGKVARNHAHLIALAGDNVGRTYRLDETVTTIGRSDEARVRLYDDGVSRRHAQLVRVRHRCLARGPEERERHPRQRRDDHRRLLRDGDKIGLGGKTVLKFATHGRAGRELPPGDVRGRRSRRPDPGVQQAALPRANRHPRWRTRKGTRAPSRSLMIDIDLFKKVNDSYGHLAGDYVLTTLAQLVIAAVRTEDLVARYGGEEFAVLCRSTALARRRSWRAVCAGPWRRTSSCTAGSASR